MDDQARDRFMEWFAHVQPSLRAYVRALVGRQADADDILQEVSLALWKGLDAYDASRPFLPWALGIARNQVARWRRSQARAPRALPDEAEAQLAAAFVELEDELDGRRHALRGCLEHVGAHGRELLDLRYGQQRELADIARQRGTTLNAVNKSLGKIRRLLADCIDRHQAQEEA